jgi:hypothetical protein
MIYIANLISIYAPEHFRSTINHAYPVNNIKNILLTEFRRNHGSNDNYNTPYDMYVMNGIIPHIEYVPYKLYT